MARPKNKPEATEILPDAPVAKSTKMVVSLIGYSVNPLTGVKYDTTPTEYAEQDGWVEAQLAAGKFQLVNT